MLYGLKNNDLLGLRNNYVADPIILYSSDHNRFIVFCSLLQKYLLMHSVNKKLMAIICVLNF